MLDDDMVATGLQDDRDPDGTDVYGMIPLLTFVDDEEENEDEDDSSGADDEESELPPLIEPSSFEVEVPEDTELTDDDEAFQALTARGVTDMFPGEAHALIDYMRPLTEEEREIVEDPYLNDLRWTDDPSHTDDVLKAGKSERGMDNYLDDATYGDIHMKSPEEIAERFGTDKIPAARGKAQISPVRPSNKLINATVVVGLTKKLTVEHANWLAEKDKQANIAVRPRSYYENVGRLWARNQLAQAKVPTTSTSGAWMSHPRKFVHTANQILFQTKNVRSRFSPTLGDQVDMGGWNPFHAVKSAFKAVEHGVEKGASLAYRGAKFGLTKPFEYTYKGIKYVGEKAMQFALKPIKMVVGRFKKKMVNRKAAELAKQRGLAAPGPTEIAQATTWTKNVTKHSSSRYARAAASLMGNDPGYGARNVDITFGDANNDLMGVAPALLYPLIVLGAVGLAVILDKVYNAAFKHGSSAPAADPNVVALDTADPSASDPGAGDPGAGDPGAGDPGAGDPGADPGYADDGSTDSSGRSRSARDYLKAKSHALANKWSNRGITLEELNALPIKQRRKVQKLIQSGRYRLA